MPTRVRVSSSSPRLMRVTGRFFSSARSRVLGPTSRPITSTTGARLRHRAWFRRVCRRKSEAAVDHRDLGTTLARRRSRGELARPVLRSTRMGIPRRRQPRPGDQHQRANGWTFEVVVKGVRTSPIQLQVPGQHNMLNATAALVYKDLGWGTSGRACRILWHATPI